MNRDEVPQKAKRKINKRKYLLKTKPNQKGKNALLFGGTSIQILYFTYIITSNYFFSNKPYLANNSTLNSSK